MTPTPSSPSKPKHVPLRRCVVCRAQRPQAELLRFYRDEEGIWRLDPKRRAGGRGAWVCADNPECHTQKRLGRTFRAQSREVSETIRKFRESTIHTTTPNTEA